MNTVHLSVDLNCDMGEGMEHDASIMPYISSANIACGYHAGDIPTMERTMQLALEQAVTIGAHVSFLDRENFGRTELDLAPEEIYELVTQQLFILQEVAASLDTCINHVKPHGALYNLSARDASIASAIARAVYDFDRNLLLMGLSGSFSIAEAKKLGLATANEVFADRSYQDDGRLTPRSHPGALLTHEAAVINQVLKMVKEGSVLSINKKEVSLIADTICIHGDGINAASLAKQINKVLKAQQVKIESKKP